MSLYIFPLRESAQMLSDEWGRFAAGGMDAVTSAAEEVLLSIEGVEPASITAILQEWGLDEELHPDCELNTSAVTALMFEYTCEDHGEFWCEDCFDIDEGVS